MTDGAGSPAEPGAAESAPGIAGPGAAGPVPGVAVPGVAGPGADRPAVAVLGLGEAGGRIAADLAAAGARVRGFDPAVPAPPGIEPGTDDADACRGADLVLSLTTAAEAEHALCQALPGLRLGAVYADANTASPGHKQRLARLAEEAGVPFADIAIMAPILPRGLRTPMLASGPAAVTVARLLERLRGTGAGAARPARRGRHPQAAAQRVLQGHGRRDGGGAACRTGGRLEDWLREHIAADLAAADEATAGGWSREATSTPAAGCTRWPRPATCSANWACRPGWPGPASAGWRSSSTADRSPGWRWAGPGTDVPIRAGCGEPGRLRHRSRSRDRRRRTPHPGRRSCRSGTPGPRRQ